MTLSLSQTSSAVGTFLTVSFLAIGGSAPYTYSVTPGGAGGTIDASTGIYTAPSVLSDDPAKAYDSVVVTDSLAATASAQVLVGSPLILFCDILQKEMGLAPGRVILWDQKINLPNDRDIFIAVSNPMNKVIGNVNRSADASGTLQSQQYLAMQALLDIDIMSRGPGARDRKEEVLLALQSNYSEQQQEKNSFSIARLPAHGGFINISDVDGAAIPYRYRISIMMTYAYSKNSSIQYFDDFSDSVITDA